jgi:Tfp pilus assembly protein PilN
MIHINLLPKAIKQGTEVNRQLMSLGRWVVAALAGMAGLLLLLYGGAQWLAADTRSMQTQLQGLADKIGPFQGIAQQESEAKLIRGLMAGVLPQQPFWIRLLDDLADTIQEDMWLTQMLSRPSAQEGEMGLTLFGEAYHKVAVADFLRVLETMPVFRKVRLESLTESQTPAGSMVQFKITCQYFRSPQAVEAGS